MRGAAGRCLGGGTVDIPLVHKTTAGASKAGTKYNSHCKLKTTNFLVTILVVRL